MVERALQLSENSAEKHLRQIENSTVGIAFLGTPHAGSGFAPFAKSVGKALSFLGKRVNTDILEALKRDSQILLDVEDWFGHWRRRRAETNPVQITCFFEELELPAFGKVVEETQARIAGYSSYGIHANHMVRRLQHAYLCLGLLKPFSSSFSRPAFQFRNGIL